ncbi:MAG: alpha/beta hydrolase [Herbiconiux sp.]|nr:alpha/beta hydrolase [Herbiconiux sp.]
MDVILIAGFWLTGDSWSRVTPALQEAGLTVHTPTLGGLHSVDDDRSAITLASQTAEVVALVDGIPADREVVLVGHSGGGAVIHGVVDARPQRVTRAVYVDSGPTPDGVPINAEIPSVGDDVLLPPWEDFSDDDLRDLDEEQRARFREIAVPEPARVARDPQRLRDPARYTVPVTLISCTFTRAEIDEAVAAGAPFFAELPLIERVSVIELTTGHWPQFTKPRELAEAILEAVGRA